MTVRAIRYVALADGTSWVQVDTNGNRWRCVASADGKRAVHYAATWHRAWAMADEWKDGSLG